MPPAQPTTEDQSDPSDPDEPDSCPSSPEDRADTIQVQAVFHTDIAQTQIEGWLDVQFRRAVALCQVDHAELNIVVVADEEMAQLHEQYTGVEGTTDVLTFDLTDSAEGGLPPRSEQGPRTIEGDIVVCLDEAKRQAEQRDHEPHHELLLYAVHGLMHLLGEDDHDDEAYQRMHAREDALLTQMGFGPLFEPDRNA